MRNYNALKPVAAISGDEDIPLWRNGQTEKVTPEQLQTYMENRGFLVEYRDTYWDDIVGSLIGRQLSSTAGTVDYDWAENAIAMSPGGSIANANDRIVFNVQKPHKAITDGQAHLHIHWEQTSTNQIEWAVQYRVQSNGSAKTTTWEDATANSADDSIFPYTEETTGTINQITRLATIDLTGAGLSSTIQVRVTRTDSTAGDILATFIDFHMEFDQPGSSTEYSK